MTEDAKASQESPWIDVSHILGAIVHTPSYVFLSEPDPFRICYFPTFELPQIIKDLQLFVCYVT